jgi:hypothetical protein
MILERLKLLIVLKQSCTHNLTFGWLNRTSLGKIFQIIIVEFELKFWQPQRNHIFVKPCFTDNKQDELKVTDSCILRVVATRGYKKRERHIWKSTDYIVGLLGQTAGSYSWWSWANGPVELGQRAGGAGPGS